MSEKNQSYEDLMTRLDAMRRRVAELETTLQQIVKGCSHVLRNPHEDDSGGTVADFGWWAERAARLKALDVPDVSSLSPEDLASLIHELQVSQVEVKMQNAELRQVHEELTQARDKYSTLYDSAPVGYFTLSKDGIILEANLTGSNQLGRPRESLIGKPFSSFVAKESYGTYFRHLQRIFTTNIAKETCEIKLERTDTTGFRARFETASTEEMPGYPPTCNTIVSDITELKKAEEALRESEELHRVTLASISDTVLITDGQGDFTYICPNVHVIFGYSSDEVWSFGHVERLLGPALFDSTLLGETEEIENIERRITDKSGREHVLLINIKAVSIKGGTVLYSCRDITARKRAEEALESSLRNFMERSPGQS